MPYSRILVDSIGRANILSSSAEFLLTFVLNLNFTKIIDPDRYYDTTLYIYECACLLEGMEDINNEKARSYTYHNHFTVVMLQLGGRHLSRSPSPLFLQPESRSTP